MSKRKYTQIKMIEDMTQAMRSEGIRNGEIAEHFGLELNQIKNWVNRHNKEGKRIEAGDMPRPKGRPRKDAAPRNIEVEQAYEINRLKMENKLLRDFLQLTGRK